MTRKDLPPDNRFRRWQGNISQRTNSVGLYHPTQWTHIQISERTHIQRKHHLWSDGVVTIDVSPVYKWKIRDLWVTDLQKRQKNKRVSENRGDNLTRCCEEVSRERWGLTDARGIKKDDIRIMDWCYWKYFHKIQRSLLFQWIWDLMDQ
jgi:hypothetical protein